MAGVSVHGHPRCRQTVKGENITHATFDKNMFYTVSFTGLRGRSQATHGQDRRAAQPVRSLRLLLHVPPQPA